MTLIRLLILLLVPVLLALPFIPLRWVFSYSYYSTPNVSRRRTLINILVMVGLAVLCIIFMPKLRNFALWLGDLKLIRWIISKIPVYASYATDLAVTIFVNLLYCFVSFVVLLALNRGERIGDRIKNGVKDGKTKLKNRKKNKDKKDKNKEEIKNDPKTGEPSETEPQLTEDADEVDELPPQLLPSPEQPVTDNRIVIPGRKVEKKNAEDKKKKEDPALEEEVPKTGLRALLHRLYSLFFEKAEARWYVKPQTQHVAKHLRNFLLLVGGMYVLVFLLLLTPALFHVKVLEEPLYKLLQFFLTVNYLYPVLALAILVLIFHLMSGKGVPVPPAEAETDPESSQTGRIIDLDQVEANLMKICGNDYDVQSFFSGDVQNNSADRLNMDPDGNDLLRSVAEYVRSEGLELNQEYLQGVQSIFDGKNVLFHAPLYTAVGVYVYAALNLRIMQGERVIVICHNPSQIPNYIEQMNQGFLELTRTHKPLWKIVTRDGLGKDPDADVLVLTPEDFRDEAFFAASEDFFRQVTAALLPDANQVVSANNYYCQVIAQRLRQLCRKAPQYIFLSARTTLNLDNALTEYFLLDGKPEYARGDYSYGDAHIYIWRTKKDGAVLLDNAARAMPIEVCIGDIANQFGITDPNLISDSAIFSNQINPHWLDIYDASRRPLGFAIVADDSFNLPSVIYAYSRYIGKKASVLHVICRQYLLRNYFYAHAPRYLFEQPLLERCMVEHATEEKTAMVLLLCRLMEGIPVETFVTEMQKLHCGDGTAADDFNALSELVDMCLQKALGDKPSDSQEHFTLFKPKNVFYPQQYIRIREGYDVLGRLLEETELIELRFTNSARQPVCINLFRRMLDQRYLVGQNLVYANQNYEIRRIDREHGIITVDDASNVHGLAKDYVQLREYKLLSPAFAQHCREPGSEAAIAAELTQMRKDFIGEENIAKGLYMVKSDGEFTVSSDTTGYYMIHTDGRALSVADGGIQVIRLPEASRPALHREVKGGIYLRLELNRSRDDRLTMTLAVLLQEMMKTLFPDSYFCLSVCPILEDPQSIFEHPDFASRSIAQFYSTLDGWGEVCPDSIELLIVDDCRGGTGAMNLLFDAEGTFLQNVLWMLSDYLQWQKDNEKSPYIFFGLETQPEIFDLDGLRAVLQDFSRSYIREYDIHSRLDAANRCSLCNRPVEDPRLWHGKQMICRKCSEEYTPDADEAAQILSYIRKYLTDTFAIELPQFGLQVEPNLPEDSFSGLDFEQHIIRLAEGLPLRAVHLQILTQIVRWWQLANLSIDGDLMIDGQPLYVSVQYLRHLEQHQYARHLHREYLLCRDDPSRGYCALAQALQTEGHDNSFLYLLKERKQGGGPAVKRKEPKKSTRVPPDKEVPYYHRSLLTPEQQAAYDLMLQCFMEHSDSVDVSSTGVLTKDISLVCDSVDRDHPEIFWTNGAESHSYNPDGTVIEFKPVYTMSKEMREQMQQQIDDAIEPFLEGFSEEMGDYEIALRLFERMEEIVDYDSIELDRFHRKTGAQRMVEPDPLHNICGVFVDHKAVCAGYAKAYMLLLRKFGIEGIFVAGCSLSGGRHAWNIVRLEGDYYHIDTTWGDGSNTDPARASGKTYAYFALTDEEIRRSHTVDAKPRLPRCTAEGCNYYVRNGLHFTKYAPDEIRAVLTERLKDPQCSFVELRFENTALLHNAKHFLCDNGGIYEIARAAGRKLNSSGNVQREDLGILRIYLK